MRRHVPNHVIFTFLLLALLWLVSCSSAAAPTPPAKVHLRAIGADSMQWLVSALAHSYTTAHPDTAISVEPSSSASGIGAASEISHTIGMVSRTIKPNELSELRAVVIARDGVAIIANQSNPINAIQPEQIVQVFSGAILNWPTGPSAAKSIVVVSREEGSGTRNAFEAMIMNHIRVTPTAVVMPGEAAVVNYVGEHPDAIGYASMGVLSPRVHALAVNDVLLSPQTVENQQYPFVRTLSLVIPLHPEPEIQAFVDFALSAEGQGIIGQKYGRAPQGGG